MEKIQEEKPREFSISKEIYFGKDLCGGWR
jgi:hypothetical protein